jgi:Family of unknown function (DUF5696)
MKTKFYKTLLYTICMSKFHKYLLSLLFVLTFSLPMFPQEVSADKVESSQIKVSHVGSDWIISGQKHKIILNENDLSMKIEAGHVTWQMVPSEENDILVKFKGEDSYLQLSKAGKIGIEKYDAGFKKGVKIRLEQFRDNGMYYKGEELNLSLVLTVALEDMDEDLICDAVAIEHQAKVQQLDWPKEVDTRGAEYTALPNVRGNLLPCNWPHPYNPFGNVPNGQESLIKSDKSYIQSNLIECWSMSWWGFEKNNSAMVVIVQTPDDAAYKFNHPAGGPTVIGPRWLASLGAFRYPRSVRFCFIDKGNYVDMAKRYRKYVMNTGQFVSLKEKIAQDSLVADLIGTPQIRQHVLTNINPGSYRYNLNKQENRENYHVNTFDQLAQRLKDIKTAGINRVFVTLAGWPFKGYDRQHPDVLPPAPDAGGWTGMKHWINTCKELGDLYVFHDQYRDYYPDAPSYDPQFAVHEETNTGDADVFPGTRFGGWKEGYIPFMDYWDGGKQTYLDAGFALGHLKQNYELMFKHGIKTEGSYLDVFGYVPPTQDFNPEHPLTRSGAMAGRAACFHWVRNNLGIVGTEAGSDWVIPYVDFVTQAKQGSVIPVPLYELVYHDAVMAPEGGTEDYLRCLLNGGYPTVPRDIHNEKEMKILKTIMALHKRVALLEMTNHEFLDKDHNKERTTFSDGTTVTIDKAAKTFDIEPPLKISD